VGPKTDRHPIQVEELHPNQNSHPSLLKSKRADLRTYHHSTNNDTHTPYSSL
jgi:hypothetical protein